MSTPSHLQFSERLRLHPLFYCGFWLPCSWPHLPYQLESSRLASLVLAPLIPIHRNRSHHSLLLPPSDAEACVLKWASLSCPIPDLGMLLFQVDVATLFQPLLWLGFRFTGGSIVNHTCKEIWNTKPFWEWLIDNTETAPEKDNEKTAGSALLCLRQVDFEPYMTGMYSKYHLEQSFSTILTLLPFNILSCCGDPQP